MTVKLRIEPAQEFDGLEVFVTAELVRYPFAFLARVIEIQHRGDGVDAQRIDVKFVDPVQSAADQVVDDLASPEIEYQRTPVGVCAFTRVLMLIKRSAVELAQPVFVLRKVRRHPVDDDADAGLVAAVDKVTEIVGFSEALRRRKHADRLVAPGAVERVFGHGQQLDVGEAHVADVGDEFVGEFAVAQPAIAFFGLAPPRAQVHFVNADGLAEFGRGATTGHPFTIIPLVAALIDDRGVTGRRFMVVAIGIVLQRQ